MRQNLLQWHKVGANWVAGAYIAKRVSNGWEVSHNPAVGKPWNGGHFRKLNGLAGAKYAALRHARQQMEVAR